MVSIQIRPVNHCDVTIPLNCQPIKLHSSDGQTKNEPGKVGVAFYSPVLSFLWSRSQTFLNMTQSLTSE